MELRALQGKTMWLSSVHTALDDASPTMPRQDGWQVSMEYVVRDEIAARPEGMAHSPLLTLAAHARP